MIQKTDEVQEKININLLFLLLDGQKKISSFFKPKVVGPKEVESQEVESQEVESQDGSIVQSPVESLAQGDETENQSKSGDPTPSKSTAGTGKNSFVILASKW